MAKAALSWHATQPFNGCVASANTLYPRKRAWKSRHVTPSRVIGVPFSQHED